MAYYKLERVSGKGYAMKSGACTKPIAYVRFHNDGRFSVTTTVRRGLSGDEFAGVKVIAAQRAATGGTK